MNDSGLSGAVGIRRRCAGQSRNLSVCGIEEVAIWLAEIDIVERIEKFCSELKIETFRELGVLNCSDVRFKISRSAQDIL